MMMPVNWMICSHRTGVVADISAYVDAAFSMLPLILPKPIWEQGVWADIFGDFFFHQSPLGFRQVDPHALLACNMFH